MKPTIKQKWNKLREDMAPMTFREKADHLWTYYYWVLIVLALAIMIVCIIASSVKNLKTEVLISGVFVNADIGLEGRGYLDEQYFEKLDGIPEKQKILITDINFQDPNTYEEIEFTYNATLRLMAMLGAEEVDYMVMDKLGLEYYLGQDIFADLNEFLTEEELEHWKDELIYLTYEEDEITIPVAINIKNTAFGQKYLTTEEDQYIGFAANTPRPEACKLLWEYLKAA